MSICATTDGYYLTCVIDWFRHSSCLCASSLSSFFRHLFHATGKEIYDIGSFFPCACFKHDFKGKLITFNESISTLVRIKEGRRKAVFNTSVSCIKAEQEGSAALLCILYDLLFYSVFSLDHSVVVYIFVAFYLFFADAVLLDALLKLISPLSGTWHIRILEFVA